MIDSRQIDLVGFKKNKSEINKNAKRDSRREKKEKERKKFKNRSP